MNTYELIAPCHFGLESVLKKEIYELGYEIISVEDGKVTFEGDAEAICRANINLRTAERVLLKVGQFNAVTFTELFDQTKELPWEEFIPADGSAAATGELVVKVVDASFNGAPYAIVNLERNWNNANIPAEIQLDYDEEHITVFRADNTSCCNWG